MISRSVLTNSLLDVLKRSDRPEATRHLNPSQKFSYRERMLRLICFILRSTHLVLDLRFREKKHCRLS